jgi:hypothetical protein
VLPISAYGSTGIFLPVTQRHELVQRGVHVMVDLAGCNDFGFTFSQIADLIEYFF